MFNKIKNKIRPFGKLFIKGTFIVALVLIIMFVSSKLVPKEQSASEFYTSLNENKIESVELQMNNGMSTVNYEIEGEKYYTIIVANDEFYNELQEKEIQYKIMMKNNISIFSIINLLMTAASLYFLFKIVRFQFAGDSDFSLEINEFGDEEDVSMNVNTTAAKSKITLEDVAGMKDEKKEVAEIIDFLKNPEDYHAIGATLPKGVLLVGPPGTGKTLLAKAIAGEAEVNFISVSGSEFMEKFVGVGASRVRELFAAAKEHSPCVVFIDEIDAVGSSRVSGDNNSEKNQTLNQLLVEMDGFSEKTDIVVLAATNRPEMLDDALKRPGRFDRTVQISAPDTEGREEILKLYAKKKRISPTVSMREVAKKTHGFTGAELYSLLNEAVLLAVRKKHKIASIEDIDEAIDRVMMGASSQSRKYTEKDKKIISYHEAGHVVAGLKLASANTVQKVTIVPRGGAGGYAMLQPKEERYIATQNELLEKITGFLAGRAAEKLKFNEITTGASNDFEQATMIARAMVTQYGMSDLGMINLESSTSQYLIGGMHKNYSGDMGNKIDEEVNKIVNSCYKRAVNVLVENEALLEKLAITLMEKETLQADEIKAIEAEFSTVEQKTTTVMTFTKDKKKKEKSKIAS